VEVAQGMAVEDPRGEWIDNRGAGRGLKKEVRSGWVRREEKSKELRYGADWAECPAKDGIDKLSPEGTNTTQA
jgi:hypothetical protein